MHLAMIASEVCGWAGAAFVLIAYVLVAGRHLKGTSREFHALNTAGALGLAQNAVTHGVWAVAALNLVWMAIGVTAFVVAGRRDNV